MSPQSFQEQAWVLSLETRRGADQEEEVIDLADDEDEQEGVVVRFGYNSNSLSRDSGVSLSSPSHVLGNSLLEITWQQHQEQQQEQQPEQQQELTWDGEGQYWGQEHSWRKKQGQGRKENFAKNEQSTKDKYEAAEDVDNVKETDTTKVEADQVESSSGAEAKAGRGESLETIEIFDDDDDMDETTEDIFMDEKPAENPVTFREEITISNKSMNDLDAKTPKDAVSVVDDFRKKIENLNKMNKTKEIGQSVNKSSLKRKDTEHTNIDAETNEKHIYVAKSDESKKMLTSDPEKLKNCDETRGRAKYRSILNDSLIEKEDVGSNTTENASQTSTGKENKRKDHSTENDFQEKRLRRERSRSIDSQKEEEILNELENEMEQECQSMKDNIPKSKKSKSPNRGERQSNRDRSRSQDSQEDKNESKLENTFKINTSTEEIEKSLQNTSKLNNSQLGEITTKRDRSRSQDSQDDEDDKKNDNERTPEQKKKHEERVRENLKKIKKKPITARNVIHGLSNVSLLSLLQFQTEALNKDLFPCPNKNGIFLYSQNPPHWAV